MPYDLGKAVIVRETDRAYLLRFDANEERLEKWVPKSVIEFQDVYNVGETGNFEVKTWWSEKEGLE